MGEGYGLIVEGLVEAGYLVFYEGFAVSLSRDVRQPKCVYFRINAVSGGKSYGHSFAVSNYDLEVLTPPMAKKIASDALNRLREVLEEQSNQGQKLA